MKPQVRTALAFIFLSVAACSRPPATPLTIAERDKKPVTFSFTAVDGSTVDMSKLRGKVVLLDFWATWCQPCVQEVPELVSAYQKYHERGFEIIGISLDYDKEKLTQFTRSHNMPWPQFFEPNSWPDTIAEAYGIPSLWLIDKNGLIATRQAHLDLAVQVEKLLAE